MSDFADLTRPRTIDDLLAETEQLAADGAAAGRASLSDSDDDVQRETLRERLGSGRLRGLERSVDRGETVEGWKARPVATPPEPKVVRADAGFGAWQRGEIADTDSAMSGDAIMAAEDARRGWPADPGSDHVAGGTYDGITACAANRDRYGRSRKAQGAGSGDKGPKARPAVGPTTDELHERLVRGDERGAGGRPRKGREVRERFSVRAERGTRTTIAATGFTESDFLAEAAKLVEMARTGAQADDLMRAVIALAGEAAEQTAA